MEFIKIESKHLDSYKIEAGVLYIKFRVGGTYEYKNIPTEILEEFETYQHKGEYFREAIKPKYRGVKYNG